MKMDGMARHDSQICERCEHWWHRLNIRKHGDDSKKVVLSKTIQMEF